MSPRRNWDSPTPLAASECALPPGPKGGGAHSSAAQGVGESQFLLLEKKLSTLPTLCIAPFYISSPVLFKADLSSKTHTFFKHPQPPMPPILTGISKTIAFLEPYFLRTRLFFSAG